MSGTHEVLPICVHLYFISFSGGESEIHLKTRKQVSGQREGLSKPSQKTRKPENIFLHCSQITVIKPQAQRKSFWNRWHVDS